jgi:hypothetical protein
MANSWENLQAFIGSGDAYKDWRALGIIVVALLGLGLINAATRRAAIVLAVALMIPLILKAQKK